MSTTETWLQKIITGRSKHKAWTLIGIGSNLIDTMRGIVERAADRGTMDKSVIAVDLAMDEEAFKLERNLDEVDLLADEEITEPDQTRRKRKPPRSKLRISGMERVPP